MNRPTPRILVIDDEAMILRVVVRMLVLLGAEPTGVASLTEARVALANARFDLVLSDVGLGDGSGLDLARELIAAGSPPVVLMSGAADQLARAKESLRIAVVDKPLDQRTLRAALHAAGIELPASAR